MTPLPCLWQCLLNGCKGQFRQNNGCIRTARVRKLRAFPSQVWYEETIAFLSSLEILVFRGMDDSASFRSRRMALGCERHIYTHTHTYTQIHTHIHIPYLWKPHHLSDSWQSWQTFLPPTTISILTAQGSRGLWIATGREESQLDFPTYAYWLRLRKHSKHWHSCSTNWTKSRSELEQEPQEFLHPTSTQNDLL